MVILDTGLTWKLKAKRMFPFFLLLGVVGLMVGQGGGESCWLQLISGNELVEGATIWIDGQKSGQMASVESGGVFIGGLTKGKHVIEIEGEIIERITKQIQITDESRVWQETLEATRATRTLRIVSEPVGAVLCVNGEEAGGAPLEVQVGVGLSVSIKGKMEGFELVQQILHVEEKGPRMEVRLVLAEKSPQTAWFVFPNPQGQSVYVDGNFVGWKEQMQVEVEPGKHLVEMKSGGRVMLLQEVQINAGLTVEVPVEEEKMAGHDTVEEEQSPAIFPQMVFVKAASFSMGNTRNDPKGNEDETVHRVTISYDYLIGKKEVTYAEFDVFCKSTGKKKPSDEGWGRGTLPVVNVDWFDAVEYCNWLSEEEGFPPAYDSVGRWVDARGSRTQDVSRVMGYRLPTEAEWELAARGGGDCESDFKFAGSNTLSSVGWYTWNSNDRAQPVGMKLPNSLGLFDMSGNAWEWCHDWYAEDGYGSGFVPQEDPTGPPSGHRRILRGGGWVGVEEYCRIAYRVSLAPGITFDYVGFRLARTR